jgi:hypothetical protein
MKVRLTKKLAECIDGVDLADRRVGEVFELTAEDARLLVAEAWAELVEPQALEEPPQPAHTDSLSADEPVVISVQLGAAKDPS